LKVIFIVVNGIIPEEFVNKIFPSRNSRQRVLADQF